MDQSENKRKPEFLQQVFKLNGEAKLSEAFASSLEAIDAIDIEQLKQLGHKTYQKDKWTVHKILQHIIDWERIWCFRAIIFARQEGSIPEGHDEEIMGENMNADELSIEQLIKELRIVRQSTILMFESFNEKILRTTCKFFDYEMPLYAIGFTITAHQIHHLNIIRERYLPLIR